MPRFRITCEPSNPGSPALRLGVFLSGPPELERLDALAVAIRDDHPWRGQGTPLVGGPTSEQAAAQIWGPYRFIPGTGPGADSARGIPGADRTSRAWLGTARPTRQNRPGPTSRPASRPRRAERGNPGHDVAAQ